ncbi:phospholipase D family protein [Roseovarius sp. D22-M7]|uniref:phospholipase D family protein n=1 Tax=Roseovarius sp. D22-M7 TaxID=3127116 RepID=UPI00300FFBE8
MFYNQPLSIRFGPELLRYVDNVRGVEPYWDQLDIAVAWVRASGVSHLENSLTRFLSNGGHLTFVVGIDLQNTTRDGLQALLNLEAHGACETFVYHNESGSVFHPKLYLFRNEEEARLIVGSNNLTAAGLYSNVEAGLQVDTNLTDGVITEATDALNSWRDATGGLAARLDATFLAELVAEGYVPDEATARSAERARLHAHSGRSGRRLFGSRSFRPPPRPTGISSTSTTSVGTGSSPAVAATAQAPPPTGTTMLMRLRAARGTQVQVPFRVASTFFAGATVVISADSGNSHGLHVAKARGKPNTTKLEIPELRGFSDVFARFEKTPSGIVYEVHDAGTAAGKQIEASLRKGMPIGLTQTSISDISRATWWREI